MFMVQHSEVVTMSPSSNIRVSETGFLCEESVAKRFCTFSFLLSALVVLVLLATGCASAQAPTASGEKMVALAPGADRFLKTPTEITADTIEVVLPTIYRGACSATCDPDAQTRRITQTQIELVDPAGLGIPMLALQVAQLRLLAKKRILASFDDEPARRSGVLVKLKAEGKIRYRGADGDRRGQALAICNGDLSVAE
jgi:hypothetical protein